MTCGTREESWLDCAARTLVRHITTLSYVVSVHRIPGSLFGTVGAFVEMHAIVLRAGPATQQMARVGVAEGGDRDYLCACLLAEGVVIDLED